MSLWMIYSVHFSPIHSMPPFQKPASEIGAAWAKENKKGVEFLSVKLDLSHSPETAMALANMLMSGQPISFMASVSKNFDGTPTSKAPKYSLYMSTGQHAWTLQNYNRVYQANMAPQYDYKIHGNTQPVAPVQVPIAAAAPAAPYPGMPPAAPVAPIMQQPTATPVTASQTPAPANPFGV